MSPFLAHPGSPVSLDDALHADAAVATAGTKLARSRGEQFAQHDMWLCPVTDTSWVVRALNPVAGLRTILANIDELNGRFEMTSLTGNGDWDRFDTLDEALTKLVIQRSR